MLKSYRLLFTLAALLSAAPSAFALTVNNYTTTSTSTITGNIRVIDILDRSEAVQFDVGETAEQADVCVTLDGEQRSCSYDSVPFPIVIEGKGTFAANTDKQIVFTPEDPTFTGSVSINYEVTLPDQAFGDATLTLVIQEDIAEFTRKNQESLNTAVDSFCDPNSDTYLNRLTNSQRAACNYLNSASAEERIAAIDTLSPEEVVAEFTSTVNMTKDQTGNLANRLNALRSGSTGVSVAGLNYIQGNDVLPGTWLHEMADQIGGNASADQGFSPFGFFINGSITSGEKDSTSLEQGYDLDGDSITLGMDYRFNASLVAGVAYGTSNSEIEFSSTNEIENEIDNLLFYGTWYKDAFYVDAVVGFAEGEINTDRRINFSNSSGTVNVDEVVNGETESSQIFFTLAGSYDFSKGAWTYGPYASLDVIEGEIEGYDEIGTTGFEVAFDDQDIESQVLTFGGRAQYAWSQPWGIVIPYGRVEWKNELNDDRDAIVGRFVLDTSDDSAFSIQADDLDESWFQVGVGVSATFQHGLSAYIDYETVVSYDDTEIDTVSFGGRWETKF